MIRNTILLLLLLFVSNFTQAAEECIPNAPKPPRLVNDFAQVLSPQTESYLESVLVGFNDTTSTQIAIVTVDDLCDYEPGPFAFMLGEKWGVGNAQFDNGIVMLIRPKKGGNKGHAFIATGYGLEGVLPDAIAKRIVEREMIPYFKQNDYDQGVLQAATVIMEITGGEYAAENYNGKNGKKGEGSIIPFFFILFFIFIMFFGIFGRARRYANNNDIGLWAALWLMGSMSGRHGGHYNDFRSGGGGFGGGGGGFGGFGGGSFGGGGAGGSW